MKQKNNNIAFVSTFLLAVVLACVFPGQAIQPTLATDPNSLSTFVAGTAQLLAAQTEQAALLTSPLISATVMPTETLMPTPQISLERTSLVIKSDQSAVFTDYKAGIEITFLPTWMPFRIGEQEYYKAWESEFVRNNDMVIDTMSELQTGDVAAFRVAAFDIRPGYIFNGRFSNINVVYEANDFRTLEEWLEAESNKPQFVDFKLISSTYRQTKNGINTLVLEQSANGQHDGSVYYKEVLFSVPSGTVFIDCFADLEFKDAVVSDFDQVVESIVMLDQ